MARKTPNFAFPRATISNAACDVAGFRVRRLFFRLWKFGIATRQKVCNFAPKGSVLPSALCNSTILNSRFTICS